MNNADIMALYNTPSPFGQMPQQQPTQQMPNSQLFMPTSGFPTAQPNIMSMSQPAGFTQFPVQNWANDGFASMTPTQPVAQPAYSSPPAQQKPASSAFDDLFATATAHFSTAPATNTTQNNFASKVQTPATATTAAHQDLESLFM